MSYCVTLDNLYPDKIITEGQDNKLIQDLTDPVLLNDDGSSWEAALGKNIDVHYIYVCIKVSGDSLCFKEETSDVCGRQLRAYGEDKQV